MKPKPKPVPEVALAAIAGVPAPAGLTLGLLALGAVTAGDYLTGDETAFTLLYLGPIALVTWTAGRAWGAATCLASAVAWLEANRSLHSRLPPGLLYWNLGIQAAEFLVVALLLAALRERLEAEGALARTDPLTGIPNRRSFLEAAERELERARRQASPLSLACLDVDDFKRINDTLGHEAGDRVLVAVARALVDSVRRVDVVARLGGDEFALLLPDTAAERAASLFPRLRQRLCEAFAEEERVSVSIGAVTLHEAPRDVDEMLRAADRLLYAVKAAGKGGLRHEVSAARSASTPVPRGSGG